MLTKDFQLMQVCILPFSNTEKGNGAANTYGWYIFLPTFRHNLFMVAAQLG